MKNKYQRLNKEEKKNAKREYTSSNDINMNISKKIYRLSTICIIGLIYSIGIFIFDFLYGEHVVSMIMDVVLFIFCIGVIIGSNNILNKKVNEYLVNKNKPNKNSKK